MSLRNSLLGFAALAALAACNTDEGDTFADATSTFDFGEALSSFYVSDFSPFEADAKALRKLDPRYVIQKVIWSFGGSKTYESYSLDNANVEYAHAVGLTGAGQVISVIDNGFRVSHDEFAGKTLSAADGLGALTVNDHGTSVASVAAGVSDRGDIVGVAPGADLQLGTFETLTSMTDATRQAIDLGAIVQNNSWGYDQAVSQSTFDSLFDSKDGKAYINALQDFSRNGVVVFSASNIQGDRQSDIMAALPVILPKLEASWLAAVNVVPTVSGDTIVSGDLISAGCLEAAAWCIAADGTSYGAVASGNSAYALSTGTSLAAPQVAGAVALLAEAFPLLSAQEIRARLLASANNTFFKHTGHVEFGDGIDHGFNQDFGHGFLDLRAALLPIGEAYVPTPKGRRSLNEPVVLSGGMAGDALSARLAQHDIIVVDDLGGVFSTSAEVLAVSEDTQDDPLVALSELLNVDLNSERANPFHHNPSFSSQVTGREFSVGFEDNRLALLMPAEGVDDPSFGVSLSHRFDVSGSGLSIGLTAMHEGDGFVGMRAISNGSHLNADHAAAIFDWTVPVQQDQDFQISGSFGLAMPSGDVATMSMKAVQYNSLNLSYGVRNVWGTGGRISFGLGLPEVIHTGSAEVVMPVARTARGTEFDSVDLSLTPDARQVDLSVGYGLDLGKRSQILMSAIHSMNDDNVSGRKNTVAGIGYRFSF